MLEDKYYWEMYGNNQTFYANQLFWYEHVSAVRLPSISWSTHFTSTAAYTKSSKFLVATVQSKANNYNFMNLTRDYNYIMYYSVPSGNILKVFRIKSALTPM